jgi:hypothetical protein
MRHPEHKALASRKIYDLNMSKAHASNHLRRTSSAIRFARTAASVMLFAFYPLLTAFDLSRHNVPPDRIISTGDAMAGIDAIVQPAFVAAGKAAFLAPDDRVVGLTINGKIRAYPLKILTWHQVVDDSIAGEAVVITYCPLTGSAIVFGRTLGKRPLMLETSDRLYDSNLLFYDKGTKSLWSQIKGEAIAGPLTAQKLTALPSVVTSWGLWRVYHPDTIVLSASASDIRNFARDATGRYEQSQSLMIPVSTLDSRMPPKQRVLGLSINGSDEAFAFDSLGAAKPPISATVGGTSVTIVYDAASKTAGTVIDGKHVAAYTGFWFAWATFHPTTRIWQGAPNANATGASPPAAAADPAK